MKKITQLIGHFSLTLFVSGLALFPQTTTAQTGENDATFNTADNKPAYGTDGEVIQSLLQPDNKTILAGYFSHYNNEQANGLIRINSDGQLDNSFNTGTGADNGINALALQFDNKLIIGGGFTSYNGASANHIARLYPTGGLDEAFNSGTGANKNVYSLTLQVNGKILVGGDFTTYDDKPVNKLVRLNSDGTLDNTFHFSDSVEYVDHIVVQPDGKILVSGRYTNYKLYLIRLNKNGSKDVTFSYPDLFAWGYPNFETIILQGKKILVGGGIASGIETRSGLLLRLNSNGSVDTTFTYKSPDNVWIKALTLQQDGKIVFTGRAWIYADDNVSTNYISRLNANGTKDSTFKTHSEERKRSISSNTISIQSDGKIIVGGYFSTISNLLVDNIVRLNNNGDFDLTFNQKTGANGSIFSSAKQSDGAILIGGNFTYYNYKFANQIARLKKDGSLDPSFNSGTGANGSVYAIAVQSNGKIIIGGDFTTYNNVPRNHIARLNKNGTLDKTFNNATVNGTVYTLSLQQNGKIIIGGAFTTVNGTSIASVARLQANGKLDAGFSSPIVDNESPIVYASKIQDNGRILVGGYFKGSYSSGALYYNLIRLKPNGNLDNDFKGSVPKSVYAIALQPDDKIVIGGGRVQIGYDQIDPFKGYITRLNANGTADTLFESPFNTPSHDLGNPVRTISILKNGKIVFGGQFSFYNDPLLNHIGLLNENGTLDSSFTANANSSVFTSLLLRRNKLIIAGDFTLYNEAVRTGIARISVAEESSFERNAIAETTPAISDTPSLIAFPNPASEDISISNLLPGSRLIIRNVLGEVMEEKNVNTSNERITLGNYTNGIYFITAENKGTQSNLKFIVNK